MSVTAEVRKMVTDKGIDVTTVEGYFIEQLCQNGMFPEQAVGVMELARERFETQSLGIKWKSSYKDYPEVILPVLWVGIQTAALEWIDKNIPKAWFRPMFDRNDPIHKE
jgi:hypothetical protein